MGTNAVACACKCAMRRHAAVLGLLLLPLGSACASHTDDDDAIEAPEEADYEPAPRELAAQQDPRCDAPTASPCSQGDAACIKLARKESIKCEYEMLEARKAGDRRAFECWRSCLVELVDEMCSAGDESACTQRERIDESLRK